MILEKNDGSRSIFILNKAFYESEPTAGQQKAKRTGNYDSGSYLEI